MVWNYTSTLSAEDAVNVLNSDGPLEILMKIRLTQGSELLFSDRLGEPLATVEKLLNRVRCVHPQRTAGWCDESGRLRTTLAVFVNGEHIRYRQGFHTELKDGDEVHVIPLIAGG